MPESSSKESGAELGCFLLERNCFRRMSIRDTSWELNLRGALCCSLMFCPLWVDISADVQLNGATAAMAALAPSSAVGLVRGGAFQNSPFLEDAWDCWLDSCDDRVELFFSKLFALATVVDGISNSLSVSGGVQGEDVLWISRA